jgi:hypothetical protein
MGSANRVGPAAGERSASQVSFRVAVKTNGSLTRVSRWGADGECATAHSPPSPVIRLSRTSGRSGLRVPRVATS